MAVADKKVVGAPFGNASEFVRVTWDFAVDGGAIKDFDLLVAKSPIVVKLVNADVKAAVTSADAIALDLGKNDGGTEFWSDKLKATLGLNAQTGGSTAAVALDANDKIVLGIEAFVATAGKIQFLFEVFARI
jgi:hypothetical protein